MCHLLEMRGNRILDGEEAIAAVRDRLTGEEMDRYRPKLHPELDLIKTDIVVEHPWYGIRMFELESRWRDEDGRDHFEQLRRYHFHGDGYYSTVHVPGRKVLNGNVSDVYVGFSPLLCGIYVMWMDTIRRHYSAGHYRRIRAKAHGTNVKRDLMIDVSNVPEDVTFVRIRPESGPDALGLTFDPEADRWILPS